MSDPVWRAFKDACSADNFSSSEGSSGCPAPSRPAFLTKNRQLLENYRAGRVLLSIVLSGFYWHSFWIREWLTGNLV